MPQSHLTRSRPFAHPRAERPHRSGFTLTEILVAIGIIALLIAILLPALSKALAKARATQTSSTMQQFAKACDAYYQEFNRYPGIVPENILALDPKISGTENALLALMGGAIDQDDPRYPFPEFSQSNGWVETTFGSGTNQFKIKVNAIKIGDGPRVGGKQFAPFFSPKPTEVARTKQDAGNGQPTIDLPDLVDAWGQPILYLRAMRDVGPLVGDVNVAQFARGSIAPYIAGIVELGELGQNQEPSIFNVAATADIDATLAQIIRSPAIGKGDAPLNGTARGRFIIISAGPDGIFFSSNQVKKANNTPLTDIISVGSNPAGPDLVKLYDDIIVSGGS